MEEKYSGKNPLMLNYFVVLLLTSLALITLSCCCFDNTDPPDSDQDDSNSSQEPCVKKIKSSSSRVETNVPSRANRAKYLKSKHHSLTLRSAIYYLFRFRFHAPNECFWDKVNLVPSLMELLCMQVTSHSRRVVRDTCLESLKCLKSKPEIEFDPLFNYAKKESQENQHYLIGEKSASDVTVGRILETGQVLHVQ